jgi:hypothetical protein
MQNIYSISSSIQKILPIFRKIQWQPYVKMLRKTIEYFRNDRQQMSTYQTKNGSNNSRRYFQKK